MVMLGECEHCRCGNHDKCEGGTPGQPGMLGGGLICTCTCRNEKRLESIKYTPSDVANRSRKRCPNCGHVDEAAMDKGKA